MIDHSSLPAYEREIFQRTVDTEYQLATYKLYLASRPSQVYRPELRNEASPLNAGRWYCTYQNWRFPSADTPELAMVAFDEAWLKGVRPDACPA